MRTDIVGSYQHEIVGDDDSEGSFEHLGGDEAGWDFVGDEDSGDETGDDMGVWYPGRKKKAAGRQRALMQARAAAMAQRRVQEGAILRDLNPTKSREYILGFDSTAVPGSTSANITKRPQTIFRPERVVVPAAVGVDFQMVDIKVGKNSQFSASGEVPAVVFAETSFGVRLKMDTAQVSMDVTLSVRNTNVNLRNFTAAIIGPAVE
jgi:hypothetical protein